MACSGWVGFDQGPWRQVCGLVQGSLRQFDTRFLFPPYTSPEKSRIALTRESERTLLISLTTVCRKIRQWASELDNRDSPQVNAMAEENSRFTDGGSCSSQPAMCNGEKEGHNCLADTVCLLISFSALENPFVRHSTGKVLLAVFDFIAKSKSNCVEYLYCLWLSLKELSSSLFLSSQPLEFHQSFDTHLVNQQLGDAEAIQLSEAHSFDEAQFAVVIQNSGIRPSYSLVAHILEVLFNILKIAKADYTDLFEASIYFSMSTFSSMAWESLDGKIRASESAFLFFGALLRILCSLTDSKDLQETSALEEFSVYSKLTSMVHRILSCCFTHHTENYDVSISHYLKHKSMMLITRLSFGTQWKFPSALLWLDFLKQFYEDLLHHPIFKCHSGHSSSLEGSPFQVVYGENINVSCICHLQRQTIFLFLKCCVTLASSSNNSGLASCSATSNVTVPCEVPVDGKNWSEKGLNELYMWIRQQSLLAKGAEHGFSMSLLQFYMDEDDMLFEMLLLLLDNSLLDIHGQEKEIGGLSVVVDQDILSYISSVFNPIHLFHLFLLELHYDHSVLLDYLISKDVGIQCVRYLLRCLKIVCRSWSVFTGFCMNNYITNTNKCPSEERLDCFKRHVIPCYKQQKIESENFENAKLCLLSLKLSVQDLHQKKIFPYNPNALLRSFSKFEELCHITVNDVR